MSKDHNTVTCPHGKGLACTVCYDPTYRLDSMSQHPDVLTVKAIDDHTALNPFPPSKTACIALRALELNLPVVDVSGSDLPRVERFGDLPDGTLFYLAQTYAYGGRQKYQKVVEDGDNHNAVSVKDPSMTMRVPNMQLVFRA